MNSQELRSIQAPLKEKYKTNPDAANLILKAKGKKGEEISFNTETSRGIINSGLHPATGGDGTAVCSGDMLLEALVSCAGVTLMAVTTAMDIKLIASEITAEGEIDFRGTLGISKDIPVGFKNIRLNFNLDTDEPREKIEKLIQLTERYCVVFQTLKNTPEIQIGINIK